MSDYHIYVTFSGESSKTTGADADAMPAKISRPIQHVRGYSSDGKDQGRVTPDYDELRGMALDGSGRLYVAVANKTQSAIDVFSAPATKGGFARTLLETAVSGTSSSALLHPYAVAIDPNGDLATSAQDTNVVAAYTLGTVPAKPRPIASYLANGSWGTGIFAPGTQVASAQPVASGGTTPPPVPAAQGGLTMTGFASAAGAKPPPRHSVRGILYADGVLYVADEGGARVAIYDSSTGAFRGALSTTLDGAATQSTPVGLAYDAKSEHVYIGDPGNEAIFRYHAASGHLKLLLDKSSGGKALEKVSGLAWASNGTLLIASRAASAIFAYDGKHVTPLITGLTDAPECLLIVPV